MQIDFDKEKRFIVICGPCSIHNKEEAISYARMLLGLQREVEDKIFLVMRVYLEKPRSTVGWKGFIMDSDFSGEYDIRKGTSESLDLLKQIRALGVPVATEFLSPFLSPIIAPYISIGTIGARTVASQIHRELASSLAMPVGFKNDTHGDIKPAIEAMITAREAHTYLGTDDGILVDVIKTEGNPNTFLILRGGSSGSNADEKTVSEAEILLEKNNLPKHIVIDCSHGNSGKDHTKQKLVVEEVIKLKNVGHESIKGLMLESNINEGKQEIGLGDLAHGVSVTDACISFEETKELVHKIAKALN